MTRLRIGIVLIIISWLPIAVIVVNVMKDQHASYSEHAYEVVRLAIWTIQIIIGLIGVWLAGKIAIKEVKKEGFKKTPKRLWELLLNGSEPTSS